MPKLVFFTSLPKVGGHTTITLGLVRLLRPSYRGIDVIVREMPGHGTSSDALQELVELGARVENLPGKSTLSDLVKIASYYKRQREAPDVFLAIGMRHFSPLLSLMLRPKQSVYYHITHELNSKVLRMLRWYSKTFSRLAFISPATEQRYKQLVRRTGTTISITQPIGNAPRPSLHDSFEGTKRFGFIGRLGKEKGCSELARFANDCTTPCSIRIAGDGEYSNKFRTLAAENKTTVEVRFDGPFDADARSKYLEDFFSSIDYLVVPSQDDREGLPTVIIESLRAGVPVVATRTGGMLAFDLQGFGRTGCVTVVDKEQIVEKLIELANAPSPRKEVKERCIDYFEEQFSDSKLLNQWHAALGIDEN